MGKSEQKLISTVESLAPEILDFTSRLVACPSTLGKEAPVLEVMENELSLLGFDPVRVEISPEDLADHPGFAPVPCLVARPRCLQSLAACSQHPGF